MTAQSHTYFVGVADGDSTRRGRPCVASFFHRRPERRPSPSSPKAQIVTARRARARSRAAAWPRPFLRGLRGHIAPDRAGTAPARQAEQHGPSGKSRTLAGALARAMPRRRLLRWRPPRRPCRRGGRRTSRDRQSPRFHCRRRARRPRCASRSPAGAGTACAAARTAGKRDAAPPSAPPALANAPLPPTRPRDLAALRRARRFRASSRLRHRP